MSISPQRRAELDALCATFRRDVVTTLHDIQTGHPGGSLSACEILTVLYMEKADVTPQNFGGRERDKIVLSKGHAAPMLYRILAEKGFFPLEDMKSLRQIGSHLQGHPCPTHTPGVEVATGPLGSGYSVALGMMLADRLDGRDRYVYAVLGDGEINEGIIWEVCLNAAKQKADRLIAILDYNGVQLDGTCGDIMPMGDVKAKFEAFGYNVIEADGHDVGQLCDAIDAAKAVKGKPSIIIAKTVKGKGVSVMEGKNTWHGAPIDDQTYAQAMKDLGGVR